MDYISTTIPSTHFDGGHTTTSTSHPVEKIQSNFTTDAVDFDTFSKRRGSSNDNADTMNKMNKTSAASLTGGIHVEDSNISNSQSSSTPMTSTTTDNHQHHSNPMSYNPNPQSKNASTLFNDLQKKQWTIENTTKSNYSTRSIESVVSQDNKSTLNQSLLSNAGKISTRSTTVYADDVTISTQIQINHTINMKTSTHDYTNNSNYTNIATIIDTFNSTGNGTLTPSIEYNLVPGETHLNSFDNYSTNYHSSYFENKWRENANVTVNESILQINDSILFIPPYNEGYNSFMNGITKIDSSPETITKVFILALVSIFGSIGNFLVVGSVIKNRNLHRPPFYFLLSMGITDLARAGFCLPVVMATALQGSIWRHGDTACRMFAFAASFFVFSSTLSLLVISVERHLSIVHVKAYRRRCHGFVNLFATIFIWVTAFIISFPPIFASIGAGEYVFISEEAQCTYDHKHFSHNDGLNSVLTFMGISSLTLFLYYRIFVFMRSHRRMRPLQHRPAFSSSWTFVGPGANGQAFINWLNGFGGNTSNAYQRPAAAAAATVVGSGNDSGSGYGRSGTQRSTQRLNFGRVVNLCTTRNEHLTRLFFIMTLVHGATWLPYVILSLWRVFLNSSNIPSGFITYAAWLSYSQVAICPLTYFLSRGRSKNGSRVIQMEPTERNEFLLENKIPK